MKHILPCSALLILANCGGTSIGLNGGGIRQYADSAADTYAAKVVDGGVGGNVQRQNVLSGDVQDQTMSIDVSDDFRTAVVTVGGARYTLQAQTANPTSASGTLYSNSSNAFLTIVDSDYVGTISAGNGSTVIWRGITGVETRPENLPDTTLTYFGIFSLNTSEPVVDLAETEYRVGSFDMEVDFVTGDYDGTLTDDPGGFSGTFGGRVAGNGFGANVNFTDPDLSGNLVIEGTFYGPEADETGGLIGGSVSTSRGNREIMGEFTASGFELP